MRDLEKTKRKIYLENNSEVLEVIEELERESQARLKVRERELAKSKITSQEKREKLGEF